VTEQTDITHKLEAFMKVWMSERRKIVLKIFSTIFIKQKIKNIIGNLSEVFLLRNTSLESGKFIRWLSRLSATSARCGRQSPPLYRENTTLV